MTIHFTPTMADRNSASARFNLRKQQAVRGDPGIRWGNAVLVRLGPDVAALNAPQFDPANAPAGALLLAFSALEAGQCQWGFNHGAENLFCGLPVDPRAKASPLFKRYCPHHVKAAKGRTIVR